MEDFYSLFRIVNSIVDMERRMQQPPHIGLPSDGLTQVSKNRQQIQTVKKLASKALGGVGMFRQRPGEDCFQILQSGRFVEKFVSHCLICSRASAAGMRGAGSAMRSSKKRCISLSSSTSGSVDTNGSVCNSAIT